MKRLGAAALAVVCAIVVVFGVWVSGAYAHDAQAMADAAAGDTKRLQWYESLKNGANVSCCSKDDGHQLPEKFTKLIGSQWFVFLTDENQWAPVPPQAVIRTPSIDGQPYLFRMGAPYADWSPHGIRCFVPPVPGY